MGYLNRTFLTARETLFVSRAVSVAVSLDLSSPMVEI